MIEWPLVLRATLERVAYAAQQDELRTQEAARYRAVCETQKGLHDAIVTELRAQLAREVERANVLQLDLRQLGERLASNTEARETPSVTVALPWVLDDTVKALCRGNTQWRAVLTKKAWELWEKADRSLDSGTLATVASAIRYGEDG